MTTEDPIFRGVAPALVTLFDADERLLVGETAELAARLVDDGMRAIVLAGTTGEARFLTARDRAALTEATREAVGARVPVVTGTGHPDVGEAVRLTRAAVEAGADAVIALSPSGVRDPRPYYAAVLDAAGGVPVLAYHFPKVSPPGIEVAALAELGVAGVKDSSGDPERLAVELAATGLPVYVGSPLILTTAAAFRATGAILALANVEPRLCTAAFSGDLDAQRALAALHLEARRDFPGALKRLIAERRGTSTAFRTAMPAGVDDLPWADAPAAQVAQRG